MTFYVVKKSRGDGVRDRTYSGYFRLPWMKKVKFVPLGVTEKVVALKLLLDFVRNEQLRFSGFIVDTVSGSEKSLEFYLSEFLLSVSGRLRGKQYISRLRLSISTISSFCGWKVSAQPAPSGFEADSVVCSATNRNNGRTAWDGKDEIIGRRNCQNIGTAV